jgi:hypothetical protein
MLLGTSLHVHLKVGVQVHQTPGVGLAHGVCSTRAGLGHCQNQGAPCAPPPGGYARRTHPPGAPAAWPT